MYTLCDRICTVSFFVREFSVMLLFVMEYVCCCMGRKLYEAVVAVKLIFSCCLCEVIHIVLFMCYVSFIIFNVVLGLMNWYVVVIGQFVRFYVWCCCLLGFMYGITLCCRSFGEVLSFVVVEGHVYYFHVSS